MNIRISFVDELTQECGVDLDAEMYSYSSSLKNTKSYFIRRL